MCSIDEIFDQMCFVEMVVLFYMMFIYQNVMYVVVGCLIEVVLGLLWVDFIEECFFVFFVMECLVVFFECMKQRENVVVLYYFVDGEVMKIENVSVDVVVVVGFVWLLVVEMVEWVKFFL